MRVLRQVEAPRALGRAQAAVLLTFQEISGAIARLLGNFTILRVDPVAGQR
jgi:hypothetical protein